MKFKEFNGTQIIFRKIKEEQTLEQLPYFKGEVIESGIDSKYKTGDIILCDNEGINTYFKPWKFNGEDVLYSRKDDYIIGMIEE